VAVVAAAPVVSTAVAGVRGRGTTGALMPHGRVVRHAVVHRAVIHRAVVRHAVVRHAVVRSVTGLGLLRVCVVVVHLYLLAHERVAEA
ncbi:MAG: hypothetical protein ACYCYF_12810, partial [Anaerolineae bacterium]